MLAVASGRKSASSSDSFGGGGGFVDVNGTRVSLINTWVIEKKKKKEKDGKDVPGTVMNKVRDVPVIWEYSLLFDNRVGSAGHGFLGHGRVDTEQTRS